MTPRLILISIALTALLGGNGFAQQAATAPMSPPVVASRSYYRTELYFGRSIPGGGMVGDSDWESFLGDIVTPLFPDGFTVLSGRGQYREASGKIAKEPSQILVFLYAKSERKAASMKIEQIRKEYKRRFSQESVLRIDSRKTSLVSF